MNKSKLTIKTTRTKDEQGRTCFEWRVMDGNKIVFAGYARTLADAINDARITAKL